MVNQIELKGVLHKIFDATISTKGFEKRIFWLVEDNTINSSCWQIEAHQSMCNELDNYNPGEQLCITVEVKGRLWSANGKESVFNTLRCCKIKRLFDDQIERAVNKAEARVNQIANQ